MRVGFDLDGTLDRPAIATLARVLMDDGHEVFIVSGVFDESGEWQGVDAKRRKIKRLGLERAIPIFLHADNVRALSGEQATLAYRLRTLGLRKGAVCAEEGIELMFDDSADYCAMMPKMCGTQIVQVHP